MPRRSDERTERWRQCKCKRSEEKKNAATTRRETFVERHENDDDGVVWASYMPWFGRLPPESQRGRTQAAHHAPARLTFARSFLVSGPRANQRAMFHPLCHTLASVSTKAAARQPRGSQAKNAHCALALPSGLRTTKNRIVVALLRTSVTSSITSITLQTRAFVINPVPRLFHVQCTVHCPALRSCALVENTWYESALRLQRRRHVETRLLSPDPMFEVRDSRFQTRSSDVDTALDYFLFESHAGLPIQFLPLNTTHSISNPTLHFQHTIHPPLQPDLYSPFSRLLSSRAPTKVLSYPQSIFDILLGCSASRATIKGAHDDAPCKPTSNTLRGHSLLFGLWTDTYWAGTCLTMT